MLGPTSASLMPWRLILIGGGGVGNRESVEPICEAVSSIIVSSIRGLFSIFGTAPSEFENVRYPNFSEKTDGVPPLRDEGELA